MIETVDIPTFFDHDRVCVRAVTQADVNGWLRDLAGLNKFREEIERRLEPLWSAQVGEAIEWYKTRRYDIGTDRFVSDQPEPPLVREIRLGQEVIGR